MDAHVAGGYFLARRVDCPDWVPKKSRELLPKRFFSASDCISERLPGGWVFEDWREPRPDPTAELRSWGLDPARLPDIRSWIRSRYETKEIGWWSVFSSPELAREFVTRFEVPAKDVVLFGVALPKGDVRSFLKHAEPGDAQGAGGVYAMVKARQPVAVGGAPLGYEPLVDEEATGQFHSWLCSGVEWPAFQAHGIRPNDHGFVEQLDDARRITAAINREEFGAEPGLWLPWLVVEFALTR